MPFYEYECSKCGLIATLIRTKPDGGPKAIKCNACNHRAYKILSPVNWNLIPDGNPCLDPEPDEILPEEVPNAGL